MVADEPDFEKYPKTCAEFAGVVAKEISSRLLDGALWCYDFLRHVAMPDRVERAVRGWEGRVREVGDGEVDSPVPPSRRQAEWESVADPALVGLLTEELTGLVQEATGRDDVVVRFDDSPLGDVPRGGPVDR